MPGKKRVYDVVDLTGDDDDYATRPQKSQRPGYPYKSTPPSSSPPTGSQSSRLHAAQGSQPRSSSTDPRAASIQSLSQSASSQVLAEPNDVDLTQDDVEPARELYCTFGMLTICSFFANSRADFKQRERSSVSGIITATPHPENLCFANESPVIR